MSRPIPTALFGDGRYSQALRDHQAPLGRIVIAAEARSDDDAWREAVANPAIAAILAFGPPATAAAIATAALAASKIVVCPPGTAQDQASLAALSLARQHGGGILLTGGEITHGEAGRRALSAIADPGFGKLHALYLAIRQPRGMAGDVIDDLAPEALDPILSAIPGEFSQIRVNAGRLFGPDRDSAVILLRSAADIVVTIELARCLPPSLPAPGLGEIELEAIGAHHAVRAVPHAGAVRIHRDDGTAAIPWLNAPVLDLLHQVERAVDAPHTAPDGIARLTRAAALMAAIRAAA